MKWDQSVLLAVFAAMLVLVLLWFALIGMLYRRLEKMHPAKYEAMGRPTLFLRNNLRTNYTTMKFLFAREHRALNDRRISVLADAMLLFTVIYLGMFGAIAVLGYPLLVTGPFRLR